MDFRVGYCEEVNSIKCLIGNNFSILVLSFSILANNL